MLPSTRCGIFPPFEFAWRCYLPLPLTAETVARPCSTSYLRPGGGHELVEKGVLEATPRERLPAGARERPGLFGVHQGDRAPAEAGAREPCSQRSGCFGELDEGVELSGRDLEVVAHGGV